MDEHNWGVFRVLDPSEETKSDKRRAEDGRALRHTGTYHGTCAEACRKAGELLLRDGIADPGCESVAMACDRARAAISRAAEKIGRAVATHG